MDIDIFKQHRARPIDVDRHYGVLIPLIKIEAQWHLIFEQRAAELRRQPGEICFPGGRLEADENAAQAAVRETCEELGIAADQIELIGPMDFLVTPFGDYLSPFVATIKGIGLSDMPYNRAEVASLFSVPLAHFLAQRPERHFVRTTMTAADDFPYKKIGRTDSYNWRGRDYAVLFYQYQDKVIWGMTAKIIERLAEHLRAS